MLSTSNNMSITNIYRFIVTISPLRLHSTSSVQIPHSTSKFNSLLPTVNVTPLELILILYHPSIYMGLLRIRLSPLKTPILRKYNNPYKRSGMYASISKCNTKSCICCKYRNYKTAIVSTVNNRRLSVVSNSDLG